MFLEMAILNLWKYRKRMLVVLLGISVSVLVMEAIGGMLAGMKTTFFNEILSGSGHVQLHAAGWEDRLTAYSIRHVIDRPDELISRLQAMGGVAHAEKVLGFQALLIRGGVTLAMEGRGRGCRCGLL